MHTPYLYQDNRFKLLGLASVFILAFLLIVPRFNTQDAQAETPTIETSPFDLSRYDLYLEDNMEARQNHQTFKLSYGDSLGALLQDNEMSPNQAYEITQAFASVHDPRKVKVGETFNLYYHDGRLEHLTYKPGFDKTIFISLTDEGTYEAKPIMAEFESDIVRVKANIENSLYLDANKLGAPDKVIQQFANIYEYSVDFQRDIQPGDSFEMMFEIYQDKQGNVIKAGDLLYTSFSPRGKTAEYYLYEDDKGRENFYDPTGKTAKRKLRATPINGARLSSRFGKRRHPILGYRKMHTGVDFAAPRGTPIMAAGHGVIERANVYGGYGKYIRIRHTDGYKTAYAHMSRFARGMRPGVRVRQDQIIGYVGSTGRSTGPHLHYEVHLNGRKINPRRLSQLSGRPIAKKDMAAFKARKAEIDAQRAEARLFISETMVEDMVAEATSSPE